MTFDLLAALEARGWTALPLAEADRVFHVVETGSLAAGASRQTARRLAVRAARRVFAGKVAGAGAGDTPTRRRRGVAAHPAASPEVAA